MTKKELAVAEVVAVEVTEEVKAPKATKATKATKAKTAPKTEAVEYPEVGTFTERKDLQKFYKKLTDEQLAEWCELDGLTFTPNDSKPINRMRMAMAILYSHFPKQTAPKKVSKYAQYSLEDLINMAIDNDVAVEPTEDERIMRMRTIMALKAVGLVG